MFSVSRMMPKNVRDYDGPSSFSKDRGIPSCRHASLMMLRFSRHLEEVWGPLLKNHQDSRGLVIHPSPPVSRIAGQLEY